MLQSVDFNLVFQSILQQ